LAPGKNNASNVMTTDIIKTLAAIAIPQKVNRENWHAEKKFF
jgi:hypothetical protein